jgi:hypothetical protein
MRQHIRDARYVPCLIRGSDSKWAGDDQDGAAYRDDGAFLAAAPGDAPVALAQEGVGSAGDHGGFAKHARQVPVAVTGGVWPFLLARRFLGLGLDQSRVGRKGLVLVVHDEYLNRQLAA